MSSSDWEEVKRLAADFQRAQLATSVQRLSERNCVELINKLQELNLLSLHYTSDGKSYLTSQQLHREILDELHVAGGRSNLVDVSSALCVDLSVVEQQATVLLQQQHHGGIQLLQGQLISRDYETALAQDINEKLLKSGKVAVEDLAAEYQLPGDFITKVIERGLGSSINAVREGSDRGSFYTQQYLNRLRARIRGLMTGVCVPTPMHRIIAKHGYNDKFLMSSVERLVSVGRVCGELSGSKQSKSCTFVPAIHCRTQHNWADNFLQQNGYLEFEFLRRLGIEDPMSFISGRYSEAQLLMLGGVCVGQTMLGQAQAAVEEAIVTHSYVNVAMLVPSCLSDDDTKRLVEHVLQQRTSGAKTGKGKKAQSLGSSVQCGAIVLGSSYVVSEVLLAAIKEKLQADMAVSANKLVATGVFKPKANPSKSRADENDESDKKEDRRRKAAGGKTGGGTQGRETKTRSTKHKKGGRGKHLNDSDDEQSEQQKSSEASSGGAMRFPEVEYMTADKLIGELSKMGELKDAEEEDEMLSLLSCELHRWSRRVFADICQSCYMSLASSKGNNRKTGQQMQDRMVAMMMACRLAEKGTKEFGPQLEGQLCRHLLKTQASEMLNELLLYLTEDVTASDKHAKDITPQCRSSLLSQVREADGGGCREALLLAHKATSGAELTIFFDALDDALQLAGLSLLKKKDNKREKQVLASHRSGLLEQLSSCCEPALCLHLATLLLFHTITGHMLLASGKFVPHLVAFLKPHLSPDLNDLLQEYQGLVMEKLKSAADSEGLGGINGRLEQLTPTLKEQAINCRKLSAHI